MNYDWRYENSITSNKEYLEVENNEFSYSPWRTNRTLSNYRDTVLLSNIMNMNSFLDHKLQYDFYFYAVSKAKRFAKKKKEEKHPNFDLVQEYYKYNNVRTKEALSLLTDEQVKIIKKRQEKGGVK